MTGVESLLVRCEEKRTTQSSQSNPNRSLPYLSKKCNEKYSHYKNDIPIHSYQHTYTLTSERWDGEKKVIRVAGYIVGIGLSGCSFELRVVNWMVLLSGFSFLSFFVYFLSFCGLWLNFPLLLFQVCIGIMRCTWDRFDVFLGIIMFCLSVNFLSIRFMKPTYVRELWSNSKWGFWVWGVISTDFTYELFEKLKNLTLTIILEFWGLEQVLIPNKRLTWFKWN